MTLREAISLILLVASCSASLKGYDEEFIMRFINRSQTLDINEKCRDSLGKVHAYLQDHDTLETQGIHYFESFGTGPSNLFLSRDQDRWLLKQWRAMTKPEEEELPMDFTACTRSRHEKQWFEQLVPVFDLAFNLLLIMLVLMATIFHNMRGENANKILLAFSAKKNLRRMVQLPKDPQSCITCMFGMRFLSMAYLENVDYFKDAMVDNFWNQWITNFTLGVDTFLVLGGTVLSYTWFRKWLKNTTEEEPSWTSYGYWLRFYRHRVVRLWPAYLYTLMAVTLRLSVTHFHPMWPPTDPAIQCPKHWYENVFFINSLFNNRCMPWTWYIGTEFLFFVHHIELYIKPQYRIGPYIIGIILGYYLANYQRQAVKPTRSTKFIVVGWMIGFACGFWALFGLYPSLQGWDWPIYHLVYGSIHRDVFALSMAWLIYACHTGIGGVVNRILSLYLPIFVHCFFQLLISYVFALICTLVAEYPAHNIEAILLAPRQSKTTLKPIPMSDSELQLKGVTNHL
ncbi:unnamed protein product [Nippostrongylus brasiliensis]|uniref:Acyl_transf_3 domain-containing protein n=1 Tax=Nippostrongylus brasiliensis TaxID=27835 RepID=A0A0N4Y920_NIPBR|nr:unnamed protein product [Nippostrongylus brasiliensis]